MDRRIGKHGEIKPAYTLLGVPVGRAYTETRELGQGFYCVIDGANIPNVEELISELKEGLPSEPKRTRKQATADSDIDNSL